VSAVLTEERAPESFSSQGSIEGTVLEDLPGLKLPDWLLDLLACLGLGVIALSGFVPSFGLEALGVGSIAMLLSGLWATGCRLRGRSAWWVVLGVVVIFIVVGPALAAPSLASGGILPSPEALWAMTKSLVTGWSDALVSRPPIGDLAALLVLPFASGLAVGAGSTTLARSSSRWWLAAPGIPLIVMIGSIALSTSTPLGAIQGAAFAVVAIAWLSARQRRERSAQRFAVRERVRRQRLLMLLVLASLIGAAMGSWGFVSGSGHRQIPRNELRPPLDPRLAVSPLSEYRVLQVDHHNDPLFSVSGSHQGLPLRIGVMDFWDGKTWQSAPPSGSSADTFERVGSTLQGAPSGGKVGSVSIRTLPAWSGQVWVPQIGSVTSITFSGTDAASVSDDLRYSEATGSLAVPTGMGAGVVVDERLTDAEWNQPSETKVALPTDVASKLPGLRNKSGCSGKSGLEGIDCVARYLRTNGTLSHDQPGEQPSLAGASSSRLAALASAFNPATPGASSADQAGSSPAGDAEQYAALLALDGLYSGLPMRVAVGVRSVSDGIIKGSDITAWTEAFTGGRWVMAADPVPTSNKVVLSPPQQQEAARIPIFGPQAQTPVHREHADGTKCGKGPSSVECASNRSTNKLISLPGWVGPVVGIPVGLVALVAAVTGGLSLLKSHRRRRRRSLGSPADRISAGWRELCDVVRDAGWIVPTNATRRESAVLLAKPSVARVARRADRALFGAGSLESDDAEGFWSDIDVTSSALLAGLSPWERWKARVNLTSFGLGEKADRAMALVRRRFELLADPFRRAIRRLAA